MVLRTGFLLAVAFMRCEHHSPTSLGEAVLVLAYSPASLKPGYRDSTLFEGTHLEGVALTILGHPVAAQGN